MISCKNFSLYVGDDHQFDMDRLGLWVEELIIPSLTPEHSTESVEDMNGLLYYSTTVKERLIKSTMQYETDQGESIFAFNRKIFNWFNPFKEYYLVADKDPSIRYPVRVSSGYEIDEISWEDGKFGIEFVMFKPFAESINQIKRTFTVPSFIFKNEGNQPINPRDQDETEITFKGASNNLTIKNLTTGEVWTYNGTTSADDTIKLKGVRSLKNNISIFGATNKKLLTFAPGNNQIEISGASGEFTLTISTRFYFL